VTGTALCAAMLVASAFLSAGPRVLTWGLTGIAYLAGFTAVIATATPVQAAALTMTDALIERCGLLIIIVLGETVTGVADGRTRSSVGCTPRARAGTAGSRGGRRFARRPPP
jgi:low temperature requirement protein LtrA